MHAEPKEQTKACLNVSQASGLTTQHLCKETI